LKTSLDQLIFDGAYPWWTVEAYAPVARLIADKSYDSLHVNER
jgi:hypothetical protein